MIEVSNVKKLAPKEWRRDMDDVPFHHLAVLVWSEAKTVLSLVFGEIYVVIFSPISIK